MSRTDEDLTPPRPPSSRPTLELPFEDLSYEGASGLASAKGVGLFVYVAAARSVTATSTTDAERDAQIRMGIDEELRRVTWSSKEVRDYLRGKFLAIQVAADSEVAKLLKVTRSPSVAVLQDGRELDRVEVMWPPWAPARLLRWLVGLAQGVTAVAQGRRTLAELSARLKNARELLRLGRADEAVEDLAWLWENAEQLEPAWVGVRHVGLVGVLRQLVEASPGARSRFERLRDVTEAEVSDERKLREWLSLNKVLNEPHRVVEWLKRLSPEHALKLKVGENRALRRFLVENGQWELLGRVVVDPVAVLRTDRATKRTLTSAWTGTSALSHDQLAGVERSSLDAFRDLATMLHRSLVAAGREAEAAAAAAEARRLDPSAEMKAALATSGTAYPAGRKSEKRRPVSKAKPGRKKRSK